MELVQTEEETERSSYIPLARGQTNRIEQPEIIHVNVKGIKEGIRSILESKFYLECYDKEDKC